MGQLIVESRKRVVTLCSKGCPVIEIRQGLKDENKVISHQMSTLACVQCSTRKFPWGVCHAC